MELRVAPCNSEQHVVCGIERLADIPKIIVITVNMAGSQDPQAVFEGKVGDCEA